MVLLVVDTQKLITGKHLYAFEQFEKNVQTIISEARKNKIEVIYVRHDDGKENELTRGKEGFEIYDTRNYGETSIDFVRLMTNGDPEGTSEGELEE